MDQGRLGIYGVELYEFHRSFFWSSCHGKGNLVFTIIAEIANKNLRCSNRVGIQGPQWLITVAICTVFAKHNDNRLINIWMSLTRPRIVCKPAYIELRRRCKIIGNTL